MRVGIDDKPNAMTVVVVVVCGAVTRDNLCPAVCCGHVDRCWSEQMQMCPYPRC